MSDPHIYTVGWICAISTEYVAARAFLDDEHDGPQSVSTHDNNEYTLGRMGKHNVVIAVLPDGEYGIASATGVARDMLHSFPNVRVGLMVGIGGGAPTRQHDIRLGDIVVSLPRNGASGVLQYDFGKTVQDQKFATTGFLNQPPTLLRTAVAGLRTRYETDGHEIATRVEEVLASKRKLRKKYAKPDPATDTLFLSHVVHVKDAEGPCSQMCANNAADVIVRAQRNDDDDDPTIHYGLIASANQLMKDAQIRDRLAQERDVLCFEMEAAGLMNSFPCLVIRGICDYSDSHKNKEWQGYAAMVAAAYAKDLLGRIAPNKIEAERKVSEILPAVEALKEIANDHIDVSKQQLDLAERAAQQHFTDRQREWLQLFRLTRSDKDATYESYKERVEDRVEGTCHWLLEHDSFRTWSEMESGSLLISADPGCGKSVLAKFLIDEVLPQTSTICYFFFKDQDQNTVRQMLCAILHQLFCAEISLMDYAMDDLGFNGKRLIESESLMWSVLEKVLQHPKAESTIIVIDALDECVASELNGLLQNMHEQTHWAQRNGTKFKCLMTTRPYDQIISKCRYIFDEFSNIRIPGEDESEAIGREVNLVINYRVQKLSREKNLSNHIEAHLLRRLLNIPHRTYLWVYLIFDVLREDTFKKTVPGIDTVLSTLPDSVNAAYDMILSRSKNHVMVRKSLAIILAAERPLTLAEMNVALNVEIGLEKLEEIDLETDGDFMIRLRTWCGLFVTVYQGQVGLIHQTAREFLLAELAASTEIRTLSWHGSITLHQAHTELAQITTIYLSLFHTNPGILPNLNVAKDIRAGHQSFIDYVIRHWHFHWDFVRAGDVDQDSGMIDLAVELLKPSSTLYKVWFTTFCAITHQQRLPKFSSSLGVASFLGVNAVAESLLEGGADVEARDILHDLTPLHWAVVEGHYGMTSLLLQFGADVNATSSFLETGTALAEAAYADDKDLVQLLLRSGADVNLQAGEFGCALVAASASPHSNMEIVNLLLDTGADIDMGSPKHGTALAAAANADNEDAVVLLLERGADIDAYCGPRFASALAAAATMGIITTRILIAHGANLDMLGGEHGSALGATAYMGYTSMAKMLLDAGADVDAGFGSSGTALEIAISRSKLDMMELLLHSGAEIQKISAQYSNMLLRLLSDGNVEMAQLLIEKGADVSATDDYGWTPLHLASSNGHTSIMQSLIENSADINAQNKKGLTSLYVVAKRGHSRIVELLLDSGADPNIANRKGWTPLNAATYKGHLEVVKMLLSNGAGSIADAKGWTPLMLAANLGHFDMVQLLLERGAEITTSENGQTPLSVATLRGHLDIVKLLLDKGAHIDAHKGSKQCTPIFLAVTNGHSSTVELLLERGAHHDLDVGGWTPLHAASQQGSVEVVRLLLQKGADLRTTVETGWQPLHFASAQGHHDVVELLVDEGADLDAVTDSGLTPLHLASSRGHLAVVQILLERGAPVEIVSRDGWTALRAAAECGHFEVAKILLGSSAKSSVREGTDQEILDTAPSMSNVGGDDPTRRRMSW